MAIQKVDFVITVTIDTTDDIVKISRYRINDMLDFLNRHIPDIQSVLSWRDDIELSYKLHEEEVKDENIS